MIECTLKRDRVECLEWCINSKLFDVNHVCSYPGTALHGICEGYDETSGYNAEDPLGCDKFTMLKMLLECDDIDPNVKNYGGMSVLHKLIDADRFDYFKYIIEYNSPNWKLNDLTMDIDVKNENLLYHACRCSRIKFLKFLLDLMIFKDVGKYVGGINNDSLLNVCIASKFEYKLYRWNKCNNYQCFELLLKKYGADPYIRNDHGFNAFDLCQKYDKLEYLDVLKQWQSKEE